MTQYAQQSQLVAETPGALQAGRWYDVKVVLLPFFEGVAALALIAFTFGLGMGCGQPVVTMLMFSNSAQGRSGEALGLRMTVNHMTRLVGPVAFGSLASVAGLAAVFWVNALMLGAGGLLSRSRATNVHSPHN